jgi:hypothetical protein
LEIHGFEQLLADGVPRCPIAERVVAAHTQVIDDFCYAGDGIGRTQDLFFCPDMRDPAIDRQRAFIEGHRDRGVPRIEACGPFNGRLGLLYDRFVTLHGVSPSGRLLAV